MRCVFGSNVTVRARRVEEVSEFRDVGHHAQQQKVSAGLHQIFRLRD
jgi:hypothetical protein